MSYESKYIKYKNKYLKLKELSGGVYTVASVPPIKQNEDITNDIQQKNTKNSTDAFVPLKKITKIKQEEGYNEITIIEEITNNNVDITIMCDGLFHSNNKELFYIIIKHKKINKLIINFTNNDGGEYGILNESGKSNNSAFAHSKIDELYINGPDDTSQFYLENFLFKEYNKYIRKRYNNIEWIDLIFEGVTNPFGTQVDGSE
jgi:hypothetical protein